VHGLAGTGKTELLKAVAQRHPGAALATLSNRAAAILRAKTGRPATTLHRLIKKFTGLDGNGAPQFHNNNYQGRLCLLDESSVVNRGLANDALAKIDTLITFGDPGQLEPIRGDPGFPHRDAVLHEIHRQAQNSGIIRQAHRVREGLSVQSDTDVFILASFPSPELLRRADIDLCCTKATRALANSLMRQARGISGAMLIPGEPLMALKNDYRRGIFNGEIWTVDKDCRLGKDPLIISDGRQTLRFPDVSVEGLWTGNPSSMPFRLGYAQTVAGAQGAEWPKVILLNERPHDPRWLYTGLTRASKKILVVQPQNFGGGSP
jgi:ATP-dependent exoDNAse (exonuclease V) alpha subunit